jgi:hypothetical protein
MKKIIEVDSKLSGLESLLGENVLLMCGNYFYAGKLTGVNSSYCLLTDASIVYETGELRATTWKDSQRLPGDEWFVQTAAVESYGKSGR